MFLKWPRALRVIAPHTMPGCTPTAHVPGHNYVLHNVDQAECGAQCLGFRIVRVATLAPSPIESATERLDADRDPEVKVLKGAGGGIRLSSRRPKLFLSGSSTHIPEGRSLCKR